MKLVVDASVAIKWFVPETYTSAAMKLLDAEHDLHAPELIIPELGNIIGRKQRQKHFRSTIARQVIADFLSLQIEIHGHAKSSKAAFVGAELTGQTVYDWTYLALALSLSCQFVTADEKFYKAMRKTSLKDHLLWVGDVV